MSPPRDGALRRRAPELAEVGDDAEPPPRIDREPRAVRLQVAAADDAGEVGPGRERRRRPRVEFVAIRARPRGGSADGCATRELTNTSAATRRRGGPAGALNHPSMSRAEIAPAGGSAGCPAAISARVNQRASSSSPSRSVISCVRATARNPSISDEGNGQGCEDSYSHVADLHAGFLFDFARHRVLEALARLDETGDGGIAARRPGRLPA